MKFQRIVLLICNLFVAFTFMASQQWIDQKYEYEVLSDVTYGSSLNFNGRVDSLQMDIYSPICDDVDHLSRRPLMLWIHGGAFVAGDKREQSIIDRSQHFAERGYVVVAINYRLGFLADDAAHQCNFENYSCVFAADTAEWYRAYYRAVQDGKGALRYMLNRHHEYRIDTNNVFLAGESAGAFVALGIGLLDTVAERSDLANELTAVPRPNSITFDCIYNEGETFMDSIARPDLGGIAGDIEPTNVGFTIKAIGNMYGGMMNDLLKDQKANRPKPAIYSFHRPCDLVVPIDSGPIYKYLTWCLTNGFGCFGIANTATVYGSRYFSNWNTDNNYGYEIHNEFTSVEFPFSFLFGQGSCADQVGNPCHAYDNVTLRENNLANFFAGYATTNPVCDTTLFPSAVDNGLYPTSLTIFPNPFLNQLNVDSEDFAGKTVSLIDLYGRSLIAPIVMTAKRTTINTSGLPTGVYFLICHDRNETRTSYKIIKR